MVSLKHVAVAASCCVAAAHGAATESNSSCDTYEFAWINSIGNNPLGSCSGHGTCEAAQAVCICDPESSWTGRSDIVNTEGKDCQVNDTVVRIMWGVNLLVCIALTAISYPYFKERERNHREQVKERVNLGGKVSVFKNRGLVAQYAYFYIVVPSLLGMGILRIADPQQRVGVTAPFTILFFTVRLGFYSAAYAFQPALLASLLNGKRTLKMRYLVAVADKGILVSCIGSVVCSALPMVLVFSPEPSEWLTLVIWYMLMGGMVANLLLMAVVAAYIKKKAVSQLDRSFLLAPSERTLQLKKSLRQVQNAVLAQALFQLCVYLAFCLYPFLYNKHDYWLPLGLLAYPIIGLSLARTVLNKKSSTGDASGAPDSHGKSRTQSESKGEGKVSGTAVLHSDFPVSKSSSFETEFAMANPALSPASRAGSRKTHNVKVPGFSLKESKDGGFSFHDPTADIVDEEDNDDYV